MKLVREGDPLRRSPLDITNNFPDVSRVMSQPPYRAQNRPGRAFTTIELLVVIAILMVLAGIVFVGVGRLSKSSKDGATQQVLGNLQGMLADLETVGGLRKQPPAWLWTDNGTAITKAPPATADAPQYDFWKGRTIPGASPTDPPTYEPLCSPGAVAFDGIGNARNQRNGSIAVVNTGLAMSLMSTVPENRSRLQNTAQNAQYILEWTGDEVTLPGGDMFVGYQGDGAAPAQYVRGSHVKYQGRFFAGNFPAPNFIGNSTPTGGGNWLDE